MRLLDANRNDSLAVNVMRREDINAIYTFDKGFDSAVGIIRVS